LKRDNPFQGMLRLLIRRYGQIAFHLMDYVVIGYVAAIGMVIIPFHHNVSQWGFYPLRHFLIGILLLELLRAYTQRPTKLLRFLRTFYPLFLMGFTWTELNSIVTMVFPFWASHWVVTIDKLIFSVHPTVWVAKFFRPWLTELMNFFYASYFFFIPVSACLLYFRGRQKETLDFLFLVYLTYYASFLCFFLFPAEGAWIILKHLHTVEPKGGFFLKFNQFMQSQGSIRGGALPSSHVSVAFTVVLANVKYQKKVAIVFLPLALGIALATVYCQYHHAIDSLAGMVLGILLYFVGILILRKKKTP